MKQTQYLDRQDATRIVKFPERVVPNVFEDILRDAYKSTLSKTSVTVRFDFSLVKWCEIFELSLIALWILELREAQKKVAFAFPLDKQLYQFLVTYRFDTFLKEHGIEREKRAEYTASAAPTSLMRAPFFPLAFFTEDSFRKLMEDLNYGNRLEVLLADIKTSEIVKSGTIRDIVLKELIDNVVFHGSVRFAHLIMTKLGATSSDRAIEWTRRVLRNVSELEVPFFERLRGQPYLALVIGDKGEGIKTTLKDAYSEDSMVRQWVRDPHDTQILEYAFLYHSTRRTLEERIGAIKSSISLDVAVYPPPPTGLYRLRELVREFRGFLYVRSGESIASYDFYNNQTLSKPQTTSRLGGHKKNTDFGGTQYKIYFPLSPPRKTIQVPLAFESTRYTKPPHYTYLSVKNYAPAGSARSVEEEAIQLFSILKEIDRIVVNYDDRIGSIVLDLDQTTFSAKALHYLLFESKQRQRATLSIIITNFKEDWKLWQGLFDNDTTFGANSRAILVFDHNFEAHLFGARSDEVSALHGLLESTDPPNEKSRVLADKNNHLFVYDAVSGRYQLLHSSTRILELSLKTLERELSVILLDPSSDLFQERVKVLLPSLKYCEGFFEIYRFLGNEQWKASLSLWYRYILIQTQPQYVISVSRHMGDLIEEIIKDLKRSVDKSIQHINLKTPPSQFDLIKLPLKLERDKTGVIITEVIGSGDTLNSILTNVQHTNVLKILPVINASQSAENRWEFKGKYYDIEAILTHQLYYHSELPLGWPYSEIQQVHPDTHLAIRASASLEGPLWKSIRNITTHTETGDTVELYHNDFLDECVLPTNSFLEGHFSNGDHHILYLFNVPSLVAYFGQQIVEVITDDINRNLEVMNPRRTITHVLFPARNPGVHMLADLISARFEKCLPVPVIKDNMRLEQRDLLEGVDAVVVIDDALVSGDTFFDMYDLAEQEGKGHIFAYVLIKRGPDDRARRFEKISEYGHWKIQARYLTDVELPTYKSQECPVCDRLEELEYLQEEFPQDSLFSQFLEGEISKLSPLEVEVVTAEEVKDTDVSFVDSCQTLNIRWKLELAKKKMAARKELHNIVRDHRNTPTESLCLFKVIFKEHRVFLEDDKLRQMLFYDTFAADIVTACKYFLANLTTISEDEFESTFCLLVFLDDNFRAEGILELFRNTLGEPRKFLIMLVQTFSAPYAFDYPGRMANMFGKLYAEISNITDLQPVIGTVWEYWRNKEEELKRAQHDRLAWFTSLTGGILHEVGHLQITLLAHLDSEPADLDKILKSWAEFHGHILKALPLLRNFSGNHTSSRVSGELYSNASAIELQLKEADRSVSGFVDRFEKGTAKELSELKRGLRNHVSRIFALVAGPNGTNKLLQSFKTSVKSVIFDVLVQQQADLVRCGIEVVRVFPEEECTVFGEDIFIGQILQNLIDNVWKNSGAGLLEIQITRNEPSGQLKTYLLDNGIGLTESFEFGQGLKLAKKYARACGGDFEIRNLEVDHPEYERGFRTTAIVTLTLLGGS
jgi:hypothetical protein